MGCGFRIPRITCISVALTGAVEENWDGEVDENWRTEGRVHGKRTEDRTIAEVPVCANVENLCRTRRPRNVMGIA